LKAEQLHTAVAVNAPFKSGVVTHKLQMLIGAPFKAEYLISSKVRYII